MNIFIGNLEYSLDEIEVIKLFALYGDVNSIKLIRDKETGRSKGYAFIEMPKEAEAQRAIEHVNGREINGKKLVVHEAKPAEEYNKEKELSKQQKPPFKRPGSRPPSNRQGQGYERRDNRDQRDRPFNRDQRDPGYNRDQRDSSFNRDQRDPGINRDQRDSGFNRDQRNTSRPYEPRERRDYNSDPGYRRNFPPKKED